MKSKIRDLDHLREALRATDGHIGKACEKLGISRDGLKQWLKRRGFKMPVRKVVE